MRYLPRIASFLPHLRRRHAMASTDLFELARRAQRERTLPRASLALMQRKLDRLAAKFNETAELEATLPRRERLSVGIALVCRPWTLSATAALRRS